MADVSSFVTKFYNLWHAGKSARLSLECDAGQASVNLNLHLGLHPHPEEPYHGSRRAGPSRLRRSARRAQARATAAEEAADVAQSQHESLAAAQTEVLPSLSLNTAVQAAPEKIDVAVQADSLLLPTHNAVQADFLLLPTHNAVQADQPVEETEESAELVELVEEIDDGNRNHLDNENTKPVEINEANENEVTEQEISLYDSESEESIENELFECRKNSRWS